MPKIRKAKTYQIFFQDDGTSLYENIEAVRKGRGLTRKGFVLHAIANTYPELTEQIVSWLMRYGTNRHKTAIRSAVEEDLKNEK